MPPQFAPEQQPQPEPFNFLETDPKKNFAPWFLAFCTVLIVVGLGIAGYFKYQAYQSYKSGLIETERSNEQIETNEEHLAQDSADISNWYTYRDEIRGFEFRYPNYWHYSNCGLGNNYMIFNSSCGATTSSSSIITSDSESYSTRVAHYANIAFPYGIEYGQTQIGSKDAQVFTWRTGEGTETTKAINFTHKGLLFTITIQERDSEVFDKILSTFNFLSLESPAVNHETFLACLTSRGAVLYGASYSPHTQDQLNLLGPSTNSVPYVECYPGANPNDPNSLICRDKNIRSFPTWEFRDGSRVFGKMSLLELGLKTGCELPD